MHAAKLTRQEGQIAVVTGIALMLATYFASSLRSILDTADPGELLSLKRFVATAAGAGLFVLVAHRSQAMAEDGKPARTLPLVLLSLAGVIGLLALRIGYDRFVAGQTEALLARNLRWIVTWLGYFCAAVAAYFALTSSRRSPGASALPIVSPRDRVDDLASEVASWPATDRTRLSAALQVQSAYEEADPLAASIAGAGLGQRTAP